MSDHSAQGSIGRLDVAADEGCAESRMLLSRRGMLGVTAGLFSSAMLPRSAAASGCGSKDPRLLLVILRGGMDGLAALAPYGDPFYEQRRDKLAYRDEKQIISISDLRYPSNYWGLHPAFKTVRSLYKAGEVAFVHGVAPPWRNRSHFDCQENLETGFPNVGKARDGWLNRFLADGGNCSSRIPGDRAIQIGRTPLVLRGAAPTMGWTPSEFPHPPRDTVELIREMYRRHGDKRLSAALEAGLLGQEKASKLDQGSGDNAGESLLVFSFRGAGNLLGASDGPRIAVLNYDGWDTHTDEFPRDSQLSTGAGIGALFAQLDEGIREFKQAVGPNAWSNTVVLVVTEFGRMVQNNGNLGSDHGTGSLAMLIGGAVKGGQVAGARIDLKTLREDRDLEAVNDLRSVFKSVLIEHYGLVDTKTSALNTVLFPGSYNAAPPIGDQLLRG